MLAIREYGPNDGRSRIGCGGRKLSKCCAIADKSKVLAQHILVVVHNITLYKTFFYTSPLPLCDSKLASELR